ncbi:MAG: electron transfer flavoprotein subunit beta/FixA family protein, partial [Sciscionella sp.]
RYPTLKGRLRAKKTQVRVIEPEQVAGGLRKLRLRQPQETQRETVILGHGDAAAGAVVDLLTDLGMI